jgi:hypothetical protein
MPPFPQSAKHDTSNAIAPRNRSPLKLFLLVFALSVPFWVVGALTRFQMLEGLPGQHSPRVGMGHLAHRTVRAGSPISSMDRLAMSLLSGVTGSYRLDLQQHGEERIRRDSVSRHQQRQ